MARSIGVRSVCGWSALGAVALLGAACGDDAGVGGGGGSDASSSSADTSSSSGVACTPGTEICDGKDNDCDQQIDEIAGGCDCNDGASQACYSGASGTEGEGPCQGGTQTCEGGQWGPCDGEVLPDAEACDLVDNDCNGSVDDLGMTACGVGACAAMVENCVNGKTQTCVPGMPALEVCDGIDNNCNAVIDEADPALGAVCDTGMPGECAPGTTACSMAALTCVADNVPLNEVCDGLDNDCNGTDDDNVPGTGGTCNTGQFGVCAPGTISCQLSGGQYTIDCFPDVPASNEVCDGLDNDCDGAPDDNNPEGGGACDTGQPGVCQPGTLNCVGGNLECTPNATGAPEVCNGIDDDCDGTPDDGNPGGGVACGCGGVGTTACQNGSVVCVGGPTTYFQEDFSDNSAGWTLGTTWQIGPAVGWNSEDPALDHTATADNGIAGVIIGGDAPTTLHDFYWIESPAFNTAVAPGSVFLSFWRQLNSDYTPYMQNKVQVWNGSAWVDLPFGTTGGCCGVYESTWQNHGVPGGAPAQPTSSAQYPTQFDLTPYKNANMRIRFGYNITSGGVFSVGSWNLDDIIVASAICP